MLLNKLVKKIKKITIYEPLLLQKKFKGAYVEKDYKKFIEDCDHIIGNRINNKLVNNPKIFSRDIYGSD